MQNLPRLVSELIDNTTATWREDRVREVFTPIDAEAILKIPLCTRNVGDFWASNGDCKGHFSVRSSYNLIIKLKMGRESWLE